MDEIELEEKLLGLGISFNRSYFKPSKTEINVFEQLIKKFEEKIIKDVVAINPGVVLKPLHPNKKMTPI